VLLLGGGFALVLFAMRLVAAAFGCGFTPFAYLGLPESHGWQAVFLGGLATACVVLLALVVDDARDDLWLAAEDGGVLVPAGAVERLLGDAALAHPEVVRVEAEVRVRRGGVSATLDVALRPMVDGAVVAGVLTAGARDLLARVVGAGDVTVRVRPHVLTVKQLGRRLP